MSRAIDIRQRAHAQLRQHAHWLIAAGYQRMIPAQYASWKEPDITGELCRFIQEYLECPTAPEWVLTYALRDDPKLNVSGKCGESRPRIDIEFEMIRRGSRPKFRFEAKRLGPKHSVGQYLGPDGMGAFLAGYYPLSHREAGMLAYMQSHDDKHWAGKVTAALNQTTSDFHLAPADKTFAQTPITRDLPTHQTTHSLPEGNLLIWHTFLLFH